MNAKPVIGFDDNLTTDLQDYAPTSYAISKLRSGRTPRFPDKNKTIITNVNNLYKPGLYYFDKGSTGLKATALATNESGYVYFLTPDVDEADAGAHLATKTIRKQDLNPSFRQVFYLTRNNGTTLESEITTRVGVYEEGIRTVSDSNTIGWIADVDRDAFGICPLSGDCYIYVNDIGLWIKAHRRSNDVNNPGYRTVEWVPAIKWGGWQALGSGSSSTVIADQIEWTNVLNKPTLFPPEAHTHTKAQITDFAHTHAIVDVTNLQTVLATKLDTASKATANEISSGVADAKYITPSAISGIYAFARHTHVMADITDLNIGPGSTTIISSTVISANISGTNPIVVSSTGVGSSSVSLLYDSTVTNGVTLTLNDSYLQVSANLASTNGSAGTVTTINGTNMIAYYNGSSSFGSDHQVPTAAAMVELLSNVLDGFTPTGSTVYWDDIGSKPTKFAPSAHTHTVSEITGFNSAVSQIVAHMISSATW
jgi:hypothetical protein